MAPWALPQTGKSLVTGPWARLPSVAAPRPQGDSLSGSSAQEAPEQQHEFWPLLGCILLRGVLRVEVLTLGTRVTDWPAAVP